MFQSLWYINMLLILTCSSSLVVANPEKYKDIKYTSHTGESSFMTLEELSLKTKEFEQLQNQMKREDEQHEQHIETLNEIEQKDPLLAIYIKVARYAFQAIQASDSNELEKDMYTLFGFVDPPNRKEDMMHVQEIVKDPKTKTNEVSFILQTKHKTTGKQKDFHVVIHANEQLYQGGLAVKQAWLVDEHGKHVHRVHIPLPPPPLPYYATDSFQQMSWIVAIVLLCTGVSLIVYSSWYGEEEKNKTD